MRTSLLVGLGLLLLTASGCKKDPSTPEYWDGELNHAAHAQDKVRVLERLSASPYLTPSLTPVLTSHLQSEHAPVVKAALARDLGKLKDPAAVDALVAALDLNGSTSETNGMNREIAGALGAIGDPKALPALIPLLRSMDNFTRIEAVQALGQLHAREAVEPLLALVADESAEPFVVRKAIQALGNLRDPRAVPTLLKMLYRERGNTSFYQESSFALFQMGRPATDALLAVLKGQDTQMLSWAKGHGVIEPALISKAAQVLGDLDDPRAEHALVERLAYQAPDAAQKMIVRMMAANALGRMRSQDGAHALESMVDEDEPLVRAEYVRALALAGSASAPGALAKSAGKGIWQARELSMAGLGLLGTDAASFEKLKKDEPALTSAECKTYADEDDCNQPDALAQKRIKLIDAYVAPVKAASECKADGACWARKLNDADLNVRRRAALELGRVPQSTHVPELLSHLTEKDPETRLFIIEAVDYLVDRNPAAASAAKGAADGIDHQLADEKGRSDYVKVNEDLRRLSARLHRADSAT